MRPRVLLLIKKNIYKIFILFKILIKVLRYQSQTTKTNIEVISKSKHGVLYTF